MKRVTFWLLCIGVLVLPAIGQNDRTTRPRVAPNPQPQDAPVVQNDKAPTLQNDTPVSGDRRAPSLRNGVPGAREQQQSGTSSTQVSEEDEVVKVETNLVTMPVSVVDRDARFIAGLTQKDYFVKQNGLTKPDTRLQTYRANLGGPVVRDKAHFFFNVERVMVDRATSITIPARPEFNASPVTQDRVWNTLFRFDNQLNANNTWAVRWLRESSPQLNQIIPVVYNNNPVTGTFPVNAGLT